MKKILWITVLAVCLTSVAIAAFIGSGYGSKVSATSTAVRVSLGDDYIFSLSVMNDGSVDAYAAVNTTLANFTNLVGLGTSVVIPVGAVYTFPHHEGSPVKIKSYCYSVASGTNTLYIDGY